MYRYIVTRMVLLCGLVVFPVSAATAPTRRLVHCLRFSIISIVMMAFGLTFIETMCLILGVSFLSRRSLKFVSHTVRISVRHDTFA